MDDTFITHYVSLPEKISYSNDKEYRQWIRKCFSFDKEKFHDYNGMIDDINECDDITIDELLFDSQNSQTALDRILDLTQNHDEFNNLYLLAAARMFSTDKLIGQAVVFSYDTFHMFHTCLWNFLKHGIHHMINAVQYKNLEDFLK